jgi:hypothetical protein
MSTSVSYWNVSETVRDALNDLAADGVNMHIALENTDDPGELAVTLDSIHRGLLQLAEDIKPNIAPLRKVAKALDEIPGMS